MKQQTCPFCGSTKVLIEPIVSGGDLYVSCGDCKKEISYVELLNINVGVEEINIDSYLYYNTSIYYDTMKDWQKVLKLLKAEQPVAETQQ